MCSRRESGENVMAARSSRGRGLSSSRSSSGSRISRTKIPVSASQTCSGWLWGKPSNGWSMVTRSLPSGLSATWENSPVLRRRSVPIRATAPGGSGSPYKSFRGSSATTAHAATNATTRVTRRRFVRDIGYPRRLGSGVRQILFQHRELLTEVVFGHADGAFEEARGVRHRSALTAPLSKCSKAHEVNHQRGREQRITTLPRKLKRHFRAEEPFKVNVVPRGLPVVQ